jgi:hypothetical protein
MAKIPAPVMYSPSTDSRTLYAALSVSSFIRMNVVSGPVFE